MMLLLLKVYSTKTGEFVIAINKTNNAGAKFVPNIPWSRRYSRNLASQILHYAIDEEDLQQSFERALNHYKNDPLFRNDWIPAPIKHKVPYSEEKKEKQRKAMTGKKWTAEQKFRFNQRKKWEYKTGHRKPVITYHNANNPAMIEKIKNNPWNTNRPQVTCEHCGKTCGLHMYKRWHGDKCKLNW